MAPSRVATFDTIRQATFTTAQAGSGLARAVPCMRARRFCIAQASSTAMYAHSNPSAVQKTHRTRSRATSMSMPETLPGRLLTPKTLRSHDVSARRSRCRFAHLKRILKLGRLRLRGPRGAQDEFVLAAIAQNLRRLASLAARAPPTQALCFA